ncbi:MAG: hypothetical protein PF694_09120 [Bacteroidetes bacterium]|jgi:hypothetical protein|nr:hypothetical protein [Bacteroidota bacterium]
MKESPILFSTDMVKAILEGRKTQTRRINSLEGVNENPVNWLVKVINGFAFFYNSNTDKNLDIKCPYGQTGDLLWVREKFETETDGTVKFFAGNNEVEHNTAYRQLTKWRPSIHMPKAAARIWLQITNVCIERLQDISDKDAIAEGIEKHPNDKTNVHYRNYHHEDFLMITPKFSFKTLWEKTTGFDSWDANPWVWVITYKVLSTNGKPQL